MEIGIISYLPDNEMREYRLNVHNNQIQWIKDYFSSVQITVVAQNYRQSDKNNLVDNYIMVDACGPAKARNYLLEKLYKSNKDFMCILDNDELLYEYYNSFELLTQIDEHPNQFENLDLIECLSPVRCGFKEINTTQDGVLRYWTFEKQYRGVIQRFAIYKNLKKYYNDEIYYSEKIFNEFKCQEDTEFGCHLISKGYNVVRCNQLIEKHTDYERSTIFINNDGKCMDKNTRAVIERECKNKIIAKYDYLTLSPEGNLKIQYKPATIHNRNVYGIMRGGKVTSWSIPRSNPYIIPHNLIWKPKVKQSGKKKLI